MCPFLLKHIEARTGKGVPEIKHLPEFRPQYPFYRHSTSNPSTEERCGERCTPGAHWPASIAASEFC